LPWHTLWHEFFMTTLEDDSKGKSPSQQPVYLSLTLLTLTSSNINLLFLGSSFDMATDTGSLALGLYVHIVRLGIGRKGLRKTWGIRNFFKCTPLPL
jgi:hypothetical protein